MSQQQKIASALLKAGISSPAAWAAAGVPAAGMAGFGGVPILSAPTKAALSMDGEGSGGTGCSAQASAFDSHPPVVLMKGSNNKTFLISWRSQQEVARSLGWKCALMIWGGPALALLCLYFFLGTERLR